MKISDLLKIDTVMIDLAATNKDAAIDEMTEKLHLAGRLNNFDGFKKAILQRESQSTTGIGEGIAIPHAKTDAVKIPSILFAKSKEGVAFDALDGQKVHLFFMIAASAGANNEHLETLSRLSSLLMDVTLRNQLLAAQTPEEVIRIIEAQEKAQDGDEEHTVKSADNAPLILAVTACPTGIAHTYMAADALKAKAQEKGIAIRVETNGATGIKDALTAAEIDKALAIIVAADKQVDMHRFAGKHVIKVPVAAGIRKTDELLERALQQDAPIYHVSREASGQVAAAVGEGKFKEYFYQPLMNGISNMLPFVVGGGLLIALSFLIGGINAEGPIAEALNLIGGGNAFALLIPVLAGFIAMGIADRPALAPGMVGGYLAASGGAGFLGGLVAGFLAGYIVIALKKLFSRLPQSFEGIKPVLLYPLFSMVIVGFIMIFVVNTPVKLIMDELTTWLNGLSGTNIVLVGMILAGMMAVDMGGPINKAAFTFGIAMIDAGQYAPQAAVMIGGMIPPLGLALATTFFKNKFTLAQRDAGKTNYIMGLSFITEGAIPFAAADPIRVIVSSVVGAAVAGGLALYFGCTLQAPHGGIFVIWAVQKPLLYVVSLVVGAIVTAVMVGMWKKPIESKIEASV
ncbi:PTS fructose transporter subunit IIA [Lysinibacillus mangiferihumi]|uniref:PTS fructose transporter subunit IIA n=1 Tax=Lysinibacillus mangiferihumi TaxID=1130819 RepID=A0A4U2Z1C6_9BACI|nr:PTS fructose transporter subunit IIABC [Lysinibacillus mangiferihumi]TKI67062.1 PTS fructose transporter subunit IIA [Lysinibacillus mangiferihumi]